MTKSAVYRLEPTPNNLVEPFVETAESQCGAGQFKPLGYARWHFEATQLINHCCLGTPSCEAPTSKPAQVDITQPGFIPCLFPA
jgi:hypothetical protein